MTHIRIKQHRLILASVLLVFLSVINGCSTPIQSSGISAGMAFNVDMLADDLDSPWAMVFLSPSELLITNRHGSLTLLELSSGKKQQISGVPEVSSSGQGGLLDIALPPGFDPEQAQNNWIYFTLSRATSGQAATELARARLQKESLRLHDWETLLHSKSASDSGRHFGSRIAFDNQGHVFFGIGDRGHRSNAQDLSNHAGSIIRLNLDGTIPDDNPFINNDDALPEIWSYGHRNPQGMAFDNLHQRLWSSEHGPQGGDEINLIERGKNYGWPVVSQGEEYGEDTPVGVLTQQGMIDPIKVYSPSIAPGSLLLYTGTAFPRWQGNLLLGSLKLQHLNRITLDQHMLAVDEERLLEDSNERIRALVMHTNGDIYIGTDSGKLLRISPKANTKTNIN
ncbi:MAG: PQQ-dependent sugar dehydrogenase [Arenicella sp.]